MSNHYHSSLSIKAINKNEHIKKLRTFGEKFSDRITSAVGSGTFLTLNIIWFAGWILINTGQFGQNLVFDPYPFGMLTAAVSLEAIILSVFVLITQNRQSKHSEIRSELDYITDLRSSAEVNVIMSILERVADKQNIDVSDLLSQLDTDHKKIVKDHPVTEDDDKA